MASMSLGYPQTNGAVSAQYPGLQGTAMLGAGLNAAANNLVSALMAKQVKNYVAGKLGLNGGSGGGSGGGSDDNTFADVPNLTDADFNGLKDSDIMGNNGSDPGTTPSVDQYNTWLQNQMNSSGGSAPIPGVIGNGASQVAGLIPTPPSGGSQQDANNPFFPSSPSSLDRGIQVASNDPTAGLDQLPKQNTNVANMSDADFAKALQYDMATAPSSPPSSGNSFIDNYAASRGLNPNLVAKVASNSGIIPSQNNNGDTLGSLMNGIKHVESQGNYGALGPVTKTGDQAIGAYQVMASNVPSWTQEVLGQSLTPEQFRNSPAAQDAVARAKLGQSLSTYGNPADAASIWFSGQPLAKAGNASDGYNTTPQYVTKVLNSMGINNSMPSSTGTSNDGLRGISNYADPRYAGVLADSNVYRNMIMNSANAPMSGLAWEQLAMTGLPGYTNAINDSAKIVGDNIAGNLGATNALTSEQNANVNQGDLALRQMMYNNPNMQITTNPNTGAIYAVNPHTGDIHQLSQGGFKPDFEAVKSAGPMGERTIGFINKNTGQRYDVNMNPISPNGPMGGASAPQPVQGMPGYQFDNTGHMVPVTPAPAPQNNAAPATNGPISMAPSGALVGNSQAAPQMVAGNGSTSSSDDSAPTAGNIVKYMEQQQQQQNASSPVSGTPKVAPLLPSPPPEMFSKSQQLLGGILGAPPDSDAIALDQAPDQTGSIKSPAKTAAEFRNAIQKATPDVYNSTYDYRLSQGDDPVDAKGYSMRVVATAARVVAGQEPAPTPGNDFSGRAAQFSNDVNNAVHQFDPDYTPSRYATLQDFKTGKRADTILAGRTGLEHLAMAKAASDALNGKGQQSNNPVIGQFLNEFHNLSQQDKEATYQTMAQQAKDELVRFYLGTGGSENDRELKSDTSTLDAANTPAQRTAALQALGRLVQGKISAMQETYHNGVGDKFPDYPILGQAEHNNLQTIGIEPQASDIQYLSQHNTPQQQAAFDKQFGSGSAARALGQ